MAVTIRIIEDGPRNAVIWMDEDGVTPTASGTLVTVAQLDYVDLARKLRATKLRIDSLEWDINGEAAAWVQLIWQGTTPAPAYHMVGRSDKDLKDVGGVVAPASVIANGTISYQISGGFAGTYTVIIKLVKLST